MSECSRCGRDTDRQTLDGEPLCAKCAEWRDDHHESRKADQHGLDEWENERGQNL